MSLSKHWEEYGDAENVVQVAHNLLEEKKIQHRKTTGEFHYDDAKEETGMTQGGWESQRHLEGNVGEL